MAKAHNKQPPHLEIRHAPVLWHELNATVAFYPNHVVLGLFEHEKSKGYKSAETLSDIFRILCESNVV